MLYQLYTSTISDVFLPWFSEAPNTSFYTNVVFYRDFHQTPFCKHSTKQALSCLIPGLFAVEKFLLQMKWCCPALHMNNMDILCKKQIFIFNTNIFFTQTVIKPQFLFMQSCFYHSIGNAVYNILKQLLTIMVPI